MDLISPGGDLAEATKIGRLLRDHFIETEAPTYDRRGGGALLSDGIQHGDLCKGPDCICASACFFVWAAGVPRKGTAVGLHRPSFHGDYPGTVADAQAQYTHAIKAARDYLDFMEVPSAYVDLLTRTNSKDIVFLGALHEDERALADILGYPPSIDEWLKTYCLSLSKQEMDRTSERYWEAQNCRTGVLTVTRAKAWASTAAH
jgi:hypothetical protein